MPNPVSSSTTPLYFSPSSGCVRGCLPDLLSLCLYCYACRRLLLLSLLVFCFWLHLSSFAIPGVLPYCVVGLEDTIPVMLHGRLWCTVSSPVSSFEWLADEMTMCIFTGTKVRSKDFQFFLHIRFRTRSCGEDTGTRANEISQWQVGQVVFDRWHFGIMYWSHIATYLVVVLLLFFFIFFCLWRPLQKARFRHSKSVRDDDACVLTKWQHFSEWSDVMATILNVLRHIKNRTSSIDAYLRTILLNFIPIWFKMTNLRLFEGVAPRRRRRRRKTRRIRRARRYLEEQKQDCVGYGISSLSRDG